MAGYGGSTERMHRAEDMKDLDPRIFRTSVRVFSALCRKSPGGVAASLALTAVKAASAPLVTWVTLRLYADAELFIAGKSAMRAVLISGLLFVALYAFEFLYSMISDLLTENRIGQAGTHAFRIALGEKCVRLPLLDYERTAVQDMLARAQECIREEYPAKVYGEALDVLSYLAGILMTVGVLAAYSPWFVPLSLVSVLPFFIMRLIRGREFFFMKLYQTKNMRRRDYLWSLFSNRQAVREMRAMGAEDYLTGLWQDECNTINREKWAYQKKDAASFLFCDVIRVLGYAAAIAFSLALCLRGQIGAGVFGACIAAFASLQDKMKWMLYHFGFLTEHCTFTAQYFDFIDLPEDEREAQETYSFRESVEARALRFAYPDSDRLAVDGLDLTIRRGERLVILGENGCGKTTFSKIVSALYPATDGEVRWDGVSAEKLAPGDIWGGLSMMPQDFVRYQMTLRENLAIGSLEDLNDDDKLEKLIRESGLEDVEKQAGGLDGLLGREFGGTDLSGGQWQRIAIARAMLRDRGFLLLDEPTSALDPMAEADTLERFLDISEGRTTVIISHRVGLCRLADRIVVMKDGRVAETGSHKELLAQRGEYARLWEAQAGWYQTA